MGNMKGRYIDLPLVHSGEPCVGLAMRASCPAHFNVYLLNHQNRRRRAHVATADIGTVSDGNVSSSDFPQHDHGQDLDQNHHSLGSPGAHISPPHSKKGGDFNFLGTNFPSLPKSVEAQQQQIKHEQTMSKFSIGGGITTGGSNNSKKQYCEELFVPEGRQNVFYAILFFLITNQASAAVFGQDGKSSGKAQQTRGGSGGQLEGALRDLAVEVFGTARVPGHVQLPH